MTMTNMAAYQQAMKAYQTATIHGFSSHDIWLKALQFIEKKLHEAKAARAAENFPEVYNTQVRITQVISMLQSGLPDYKTMNPRDPARGACEYLHAMYSHIRITLMAISIKEDWEQRYDSLIETVSGLHSHLADMDIDSFAMTQEGSFSNDS